MTNNIKKDDHFAPETFFEELLSFEEKKIISMFSNCIQWIIHFTSYFNTERVYAYGIHSQRDLYEVHLTLCNIFS